MQNDISIAWLLFAWALSGAHLLTDFLYENHNTELFTSFWAALVLLFLPSPRTALLARFFPQDSSWFSFQRGILLIAYAFCFLAFILAIAAFWKDIIQPIFQKSSGYIRDRKIQLLDRLQHKVTLWALPLLTLGIFAKIIVLIENDQLFHAEQIWQNSLAEFIALGAWFTCALYLHMRIFFGWKNRSSTFVYLGGFAVILLAHINGSIFFLH